MPTSELILRTAPLSMLVISGLFVAASWWVDRRRKARGTYVVDVYPGSRRHAGNLNLAWWRSLSTAEQARLDAEAIAEGMLADGFDQAVRARAEESARLAVQRAAEINAQFHP